MKYRLRVGTILNPITFHGAFIIFHDHYVNHGLIDGFIDKMNEQVSSQLIDSMYEYESTIALFYT